MTKYLMVIKNTWDEIVTYRFNFLVWRVRNVFQFLTIYYLWFSIMPASGSLFGYSRDLMLTYVVATSLVSAVILSSRTQEIAENINNGDLSIFLLKPFSYFKYWYSRDIGDKLMNITFSLAELMVIFLILRPPFFIQTDPLKILLTVLSLVFALNLHFFLTCLLSLIGFWSNDIWGPRFIFYVLIGFLSGGVFPLDILPQQIFDLFQILPFSYLVYFPIKVYLGQLGNFQILWGLLIAAFWTIIFYFLVEIIWSKGLKVYNAYGR
jgi:ABC-2 type transport system permease protein